MDLTDIRMVVLELERTAEPPLQYGGIVLFSSRWCLPHGGGFVGGEGGVERLAEELLESCGTLVRKSGEVYPSSLKWMLVSDITTISSLNLPVQTPSKNNNLLEA